MVQTRGPVTLGVTTATLILASLFVFFRFLTRAWIVRKVQMDDWFILAAWIIAVGFSISICYGTAVGLGLHNADILEEWQEPLRKSEYAFSVLYNPALMATKTSILVFFLAVSKDEPIFRWCNYLTLGLVNVAGLCLTFLNAFQCRPPSAAIQYPVPTNAHCTDIVTLYLSSAPVNIITDLAILFLPMPILTGMRLPKKQKLILVVTFSFGAFVTVVDVVRIAYLQTAALDRLKEVDSGSGTSGSKIVTQDDFPWNVALSFMWSAVEVNIGIVCACVPCLKPLFMRFLPTFIRDADDPLSPGGSIDHGVSNMVDLGAGKGENGGSMLTNPAAFKRPTPNAATGYGGEKGYDEEADDMGFLDFLAGPEESIPVTRQMTNMSMNSIRKSASSKFDFVDMNRPKNLLKLTNRESVMPVAVVTVLFFLWGFAYGLLNVLNQQFQVVVKLSNGQSLGLHAAYYAGYLVGPLSLGRFILKAYGFKAAMIAGLCIYSCGTLVFWPSAVLASYTAFVISNFIVAFGLSLLEVAANPFISLCGPLEYAEVRLNLSQGFQAVGTILSPLLAQKVLFKNVLDAPSLIDVQWTYLGIALFDVVLAVIFYYLPLPEATDEDFAELADRRSAVNDRKIGKISVIWWTLALGVFSQWCYVGGQEAVGVDTGTLVGYLQQRNNKTDGLSTFDFGTISHTVFAVGRFLCAFLNYVLKPRFILLGLYIGAFITCILAMRLQGDAGEAIAMLIQLFQSGIFSIIFAMTLRGMGAHTKTASALLTTAISGGAIFPVIQNLAIDSHNIAYSFCVPAAVFAFGAIYPIYLNLVPAAANQVDPVHDNRTQRRVNRKLARTQSNISESVAQRQQFGLAGILARRKKRLAEQPTTEHVERSSQPSTPTTNADTITEMPRAPSPVRKGSGERSSPPDLSPWPTSPTGMFGAMKDDLGPWPGDEKY